MEDGTGTGLVAGNDIDSEPIEIVLSRLIEEHRSLDEQLETMRGSESLADIMLQRLKKRKLALKDQIVKLRSLITPDIIA